MTDQEIFDKVATHLANQGKQAINEFGNCKYRTEDGLKCAIGALIPDCRYSLIIEGKGGIEALERAYPDHKERWFTPAQHPLLTSLQLIHDMDSHWKKATALKRALTMCTVKYNLDPSIIGTLDWSKLSPQLENLT